MKQIIIRDEFIKLGQALKLAGVVSTGVEAKYEIESGKVKVNGETDTRRGRKCRNKDIISYRNEEFIITGNDK
ncbi:MAG: RNA-binding S4 domain-containing protein [Lachnospiraceae bacterium]|nr:RNA-binding S4 domain-containing protein [Lachnospiraceae bacterium]